MASVGCTRYAVMRPVITGVRYFLTHCRGLVRHGSKPAREISIAEILNAASSNGDSPEPPAKSDNQKMAKTDSVSAFLQEGWDQMMAFHESKNLQTLASKYK